MIIPSPQRYQILAHTKSNVKESTVTIITMPTLVEFPFRFCFELSLRFGLYPIYCRKILSLQSPLDFGNQEKLQKGMSKEHADNFF